MKRSQGVILRSQQRSRSGGGSSCSLRGSHPSQVLREKSNSYTAIQSSTKWHFLGPIIIHKGLCKGQGLPQISKFGQCPQATGDLASQTHIEIALTLVRLRTKSSHSINTYWMSTVLETAFNGEYTCEGALPSQSTSGGGHTQKLHPKCSKGLESGQGMHEDMDQGCPDV